MMPGSVRQRLCGWGRRPCGVTRTYRPERLDDLAATLATGATLIPRGEGRSYGDASFNSDGATILMKRLNRFIGFDSESGILECEAGVTIDEIVRHFLPRGFFPTVVPGTRYVSVGGAIACDIHGKNHHRVGSFGRHVLSFGLVTPSGERVRCSREENAPLFWATLGGMGLTGVITSARIRLIRVESASIQVDYDRAANIDELLETLQASDERYEYSVAWVDGLARGGSLGRGVIMRGDHAPAAVGAPLERNDGSGLHVPGFVPGLALNRFSLGAFNKLYYRRHGSQPRGVLRDYESFFFPLDRLRNWNLLYGKAGFTQYQCVVPYQGGREVLVRILEALANHGPGAFLCVLKRFGSGESQQLLSFPAPGYTLAADLPWRGAELEPMLHRLDAWVAECGGRIYLAKDARASAHTLRAMYPRLDEWLQIRGQVDPEGKLSSDLGRRLRLAPRVPAAVR